MKSTRCGLMLAFTLLLAGIHPAQAVTQIKFATLAPEGSTWMKIMNEMNADIEKQTNGEVKFKIYPGGVMGDEKDVIKKMRIGQVHSAGFTGNGLGEILPDMRVLELPFLFNDAAEIDYVVDQMYADFSRRYEEKGFVLLGWAEVGFVHVFSQKPINTKADLSGIKMWTWEGDELANQTFRSLGVSPFPLSITDVMTSLQTGLVDAFYASPLAAMALQWHTKAKYMSLLRITNASGAVLINKKQFDLLTSAQQTVMKDVCKKHLRRLVESTRKDNDAAIKAIETSGVKLTPIPQGETLKTFLAVKDDVSKKLTGKLYDQALLDKTLKTLVDFRASKGNKP